MKPISWTTVFLSISTNIGGNITTFCLIKAALHHQRRQQFVGPEPFFQRESGPITPTMKGIKEGRKESSC